MNLQSSLDGHASWLDPIAADMFARRSAGGGDRDARWRIVVAALQAMRDKGRHAVRIVDADCGTGGFLIDVLRVAHRLGFTAIEGRGIDRSPVAIAFAHAAAKRLHDSAIGVEFEAADPENALRPERDFPADIVLWNGSPRKTVTPALLDALQAAGDIVIGLYPRADHRARPA